MRVLIVEDKSKMATYIKRGLEEKGYAVDIAYTGQEALDWAATVPFDLIVLDILLPQMDGITVCRTLRQRNVRAPILMLTALDAVHARVTGLDAGADDYLVKPFAFEELLARLRALGRRLTDSPKIPHLVVADLTLDLQKRSARRGSMLIELTTKEYAILEYLMREAGHVLTRETIAEHVWNYDSVNQSNVVDVYICNLRRKIDDPYAVKLIHTIRGTGYQLGGKDEVG